MLYVGKYPQIYSHTILRLGIVSRDNLPRGVLPSGILKLRKYCPGLKVLHSILAEEIVSRDGLPRGVLPSGILKIEKYCPGLKVRFPSGTTPRELLYSKPTCNEE